MENVATTLLDFIMSLLNDPEAMANYLADRDGTLSSMGLSGCGDEVDTALTAAGGATSAYYAPTANFNFDFDDDRSVVFAKRSDDDGIDDSFNTIVNESFNDNITNSFNTTINDNDFTNNGVIIDGDGNRVDNTVSDDDTTIINNGGVDTGGGDIVFGDQDNDVNDVDGDGNVVLAGDDNNQQGVTGDDNNAQQQVNEQEISIDQGDGDEGPGVELVDADVAAVVAPQTNLGVQDVLSGGRGGDVEEGDGDAGDGAPGVDVF